MDKIHYYKTKYQKYKMKYLELKMNKQHGGGYIKSLMKENQYPTHEDEDFIKGVKPALCLFKAEWCGHCKHFTNTWLELIESDMNKKIDFKTFDSDYNKKILDDIKVITGFPTIMYVTYEDDKPSKLEEYNGNRSVDALKMFINEKLI